MSTSTGTAGHVQTLASPTPAESMAVPTVTENYPVNTGPCPVPPLTIDTSQQMTKIPYGFNFDNNNRSYSLPAGSIIYHGTDGITRVFDRNGTQLLAANDSESMVPTPGGLMASTRFLEVPKRGIRPGRREHDAYYPKRHLYRDDNCTGCFACSARQDLQLPNDTGGTVTGNACNNTG